MNLGSKKEYVKGTLKSNHFVNIMLSTIIVKKFTKNPNVRYETHISDCSKTVTCLWNG